MFRVVQKTMNLSSKNYIMNKQQAKENNTMSYKDGKSKLDTRNPERQQDMKQYEYNLRVTSIVTAKNIKQAVHLVEKQLIAIPNLMNYVELEEVNNQSYEEICEELEEKLELIKKLKEVNNK